MRTFLCVLLALTALPAFAQQWVRLGASPDPDPGSGPARVQYLDVTPFAVGSGQRTISIASVSSSMLDAAPFASTRKLRVDCDWRTVRQGAYRPLPVAGGAVASEEIQEPALYSALPEFEHAISFACEGVAPDGERLAGDGLMLEDGVRALGYDSVEIAFSRPTRQFVYPAQPMSHLPPFDAKTAEAQALLRMGGEVQGIFLTPSTVTNLGGTVIGRSIWVTGIGRPNAERTYAYRNFEVSCADGAIAVQTVGSWPFTGLRSYQSFAPAPLAQLRQAPEASDPRTAILEAVCKKAPPMRSLASFPELLAFVDRPDEDPAFHVRRQTVIKHGQMRWTSAPTPEDLAAALPPGALRPGEAGVTAIECFVTRAYQLAECHSTYRDPHDRKLEDVHLSLAGLYEPARQSIDGVDTAGHFVEARVAWSNEGAAPEPVLIDPKDMRWRRVPTAAEVRSVYRSRKPAVAWLSCRISAEYRLVECEIPFVKSGGGTVYDANRAYGEALLGLIDLFEPERTTGKDEDTAGKNVLFGLTWPLR